MSLGNTLMVLKNELANFSYFSPSNQTLTGQTAACSIASSPPSIGSKFAEVLLVFTVPCNLQSPVNVEVKSHSTVNNLKIGTRKIIIVNVLKCNS